MMTDQIRVLLVDDYVPIRDTLRQVLERQQDMQVVGEVGDAQAAVKKTKELMPDVVLMDVGLPGRGALEATHAIRETSPKTRVIWLTTVADEQYSLTATRVGASSCISKVCRGSDLIAAIRLAALTQSYTTS